MKYLVKFNTLEEYKENLPTLSHPHVVYLESDGGIVYDAFKMIDLGLPSGTKWANMNLGATSIEESGLYFQFGSTEGFKTFAEAKTNSYWQTTPFNDGSNSYNSEYFATVSGDVCPNNVLASDYDPCYQASKGEYRMPTDTDIVELIDNTTSSKTSINGVQCYKLTSKINGEYIILPANGYAKEGAVTATGSQLWTSSIHYSTFDKAIQPMNGTRFEVLTSAKKMGTNRCSVCGVRAVQG